MSRIWFDLSDLLDYVAKNGQPTGIQRATLAIVSRILTLRPDIDAAVVAAHPQARAFLEFDAAGLRGWAQYDREHLLAYFGLRPRYSKWLARYRRKPLRWLANALAIQVMGRLGQRAFFDRRRLPAFGPHPFRARAAEIGDGDVVVALGAMTAARRLAPFYADCSARGARLVAYVHDLIPIVAPQYMRKRDLIKFREGLAIQAQLVDAFVANSQSTERDLRAWLGSLEGRRNPPVSVVRLARQFLGAAARPGESLRAEVEAVAQPPFVLCVGTIEPRKNALTLLEAWRRIIAEFKDAAPRLLFVGKRGWMSSEFEDAMASSGGLGGFVKVIADVSDVDLAALYQRCLFTVYPSFYEGWGLPVGEALWFGKTCVTSKTSSMPEVGADMCIYVDPNDVDDIHRRIAELIRDADVRRALEARIRHDRLRTWDDVAEEMCAEIVRLAGSRELGSVDRSACSGLRPRAMEAKEPNARSPARRALLLRARRWSTPRRNRALVTPQTRGPRDWPEETKRTRVRISPCLRDSSPLVAFAHRRGSRGRPEQFPIDGIDSDNPP